MRGFKRQRGGVRLVARFKASMGCAEGGERVGCAGVLIQLFFYFWSYPGDSKGRRNLEGG